MSNSVRESLTIPLALPEGNSFPSEDPRFDLLFVRECIPMGSGFTRITRLRTARVEKPQEALKLPWIAKLPGEKQVRFIDGQIFVLQKYVGCRLIRAHIFPDGQPRVSDLSDSDRTSQSRRMSLESTR